MLQVEAKAAVGETTKSMMDFQQSAQSTSVTIQKEDETVRSNLRFRFNLKTVPS
jgi:hypothetical protein